MFRVKFIVIGQDEQWEEIIPAIPQRGDYIHLSDTIHPQYIVEAIYWHLKSGHWGGNYKTRSKATIVLKPRNI